MPPGPVAAVGPVLVGRRAALDDEHCGAVGWDAAGISRDLTSHGSPHAAYRPAG